MNFNTSQEVEEGCCPQQNQKHGWFFSVWDSKQYIGQVCSSKSRVSLVFTSLSALGSRGMANQHQLHWLVHEGTCWWWFHNSLCNWMARSIIVSRVTSSPWYASLVWMTETWFGVLVHSSCPLPPMCKLQGLLSRSSPALLYQPPFPLEHGQTLGKTVW